MYYFLVISILVMYRWIQEEDESLYTVWSLVTVRESVLLAQEVNCRVTRETTISGLSKQAREGMEVDSLK